MPELIASNVFLPITLLFFFNFIIGNFAVNLPKASIDKFIPGKIIPPM